MLRIDHDGNVSIFATGFVSTWGLAFNADGTSLFVSEPQTGTVYRIDGFGPTTTQPLGYLFPDAALAKEKFDASGTFVASGLESGAEAVRPASIQNGPYAPYNASIKVRSWGTFRAIGNATLWAKGFSAGPPEIKGSAVVCNGAEAAPAGSGLPSATWAAPPPVGSWAATGSVTLPGDVYSFTSLDVKGDVVFDGAATIWVDGPLTVTGSIKSTGTLIFYVRGDVTMTSQARVGRKEAPYDTHLLALPVASSLIRMNGSSLMHGTIFAPASDVVLEGGAILHGAVVGRTVTGRGTATLLTTPAASGWPDCD